MHIERNSWSHQDSFFMTHCSKIERACFPVITRCTETLVQRTAPVTICNFWCLCKHRLIVPLAYVKRIRYFICYTCHREQMIFLNEHASRCHKKTCRSSREECVIILTGVCYCMIIWNSLSKCLANRSIITSLLGYSSVKKEKFLITEIYFSSSKKWRFLIIYWLLR